MKHSSLLPLALTTAASLGLAHQAAAQACGTLEKLDSSLYASHGQSLAWYAHPSQGFLMDVPMGSPGKALRWFDGGANYIENLHTFPQTFDGTTRIAVGNGHFAYGYDIGGNGRVQVGHFIPGTFPMQWTYQPVFDSTVSDEYGASLSASGRWLAVGAPDYDNDRGWVYL